MITQGGDGERCRIRIVALLRMTSCAIRWKKKSRHHTHPFAHQGTEATVAKF